MPLLFERFVARWLANHLPPGWRLEQQAPINIAFHNDAARRLAADIVIYDADGEIFAVADTKYKDGQEPEMADIYQVTFYAHQLNCSRAILIYPALLPERIISGQNRGVAYQSAAFDLGLALDTAGQNLLQQMMGPFMNG